MSPLAAVLAGHLIGDWLVQTDYQAANKPDSWKANQQHVLGYHLVLAAFCAFAMPALWVAITIVVSWVTHSIIDRRWPIIWLMEHTGSRPFSRTTFGQMAVDQALHLSILAMLVGVAA